MASHARDGRHVIIATPAASGKSLGYLLPALTAVLEGGTALYLAPTRALAADQLRVVSELAIPGVRPAVVDGDTPMAARDWARSHANYLLTTPDMLHQTLLPRHARWNGFFRRLRYIVVDECHTYRGVFGSHVAHVLRRLRRVATRAPPGPGARPGARCSCSPRPPSVSLPACALLLTGQRAEEVTESAAPRGPVTFGLWEPPLTAARGEAGAPIRRTATAEAAGLLADLVARNIPSLAFSRSRRGAEAVALGARRALRESGAAGHSDRVAAYRSGYLREDRRALEEALRNGDITGLATTTALELGVDISGLDAVLIAGWPGTRAALWQQAGRAGRAGRSAVVVLIARDDPLDTYLVHHPEALLHRPVEATVLDPGNPYVLAPHLCAAAAELPLTGADLASFAPGASDVAEALIRRGMLRRRSGGLYWTRRGRPPRAGLRGAGRHPVKIVEVPTGRLVGTVDEPSSHLLVHTGAVYPHQGEMYLVDELDLAAGVALVRPADPGYSTAARQVTAIEVTRELRQASWGAPRCTSATSRCAARSWGSSGAIRTPGAPWVSSRSACRRRPCGPGRCGGPSRPASAAGCWTWGLTCPARRTPPSMRRSACCPCSRRAIAGTWAAFPPICTRPPGNLLFSSTTGTTAGPGSPNVVTRRRASGWARPPTPSGVASARRDARLASSRPNAGMVTSPFPSRARSPCWSACWTAAAPRSRAPPAGRAAGGHTPKIGPDQEEYAGSAQKGGDPRRGGERGSPNGPAPGGQSRARTAKAYVYPSQVTNGSRHADTTKTCFPP